MQKLLDKLPKNPPRANGAFVRVDGPGAFTIALLNKADDVAPEEGDVVAAVTMEGEGLLLLVQHLATTVSAVYVPDDVEAPCWCASGKPFSTCHQR